ncbi:MAG: MSHA biogenesis protein MshO [Glaciecola sp.]|jgi:MSHA biogenesis protein MshO
MLLNPSKFYRNSGFTLIELVMVIVILGIVGVGISRFIGSSTQIFIDTSERERLLRDGSFAVERIHREIAAAVPNSVRLAGNSAAHCLQLVPIKWSSLYLSLPLAPTADREVDVVEMQDIDGNVFTPIANSDYAIVYPTQSNDVYQTTSNRRQLISACSDDSTAGNCTTNDDSDGVVQLTLNGAFAQDSPGKRLYIVDQAISYCVRSNAIYRHVSAISPTQTTFTSGGVLMAENLANQLSNDPNSAVANSQNPFRVVDATLRRNAYTQTQLIFTRANESITFTQEVHVPNVP